MKDPMWKTALNWGAVVTFLTLPLFILGFQIYNWTHPGFVIAIHPERIDKLREFLLEYMRNITVLVFGLAGLRTWEQVKQNGNSRKEQPPLKQVHESA
ncbi:MAG TPA: hypothetical protein VFH87_06630 [Candidatus Udaeobacter sp.]|nr:hypothetical protein [Candidatus Udaeobacter sp.]